MLGDEGWKRDHEHNIIGGVEGDNKEEVKSGREGRV